MIEVLWKNKLNVILVIALAGFILMGALFVYSTLRGQETSEGEITVQEFTDVLEEYGLLFSDDDVPYAYLSALGTQLMGNHITEEQVEALLDSMLPSSATLEGFEIEDAVCTVDYVMTEDNETYTKRINLVYYNSGDIEISLRSGDEIIVYSSDLKMEVTTIK